MGKRSKFSVTAEDLTPLNERERRATRPLSERAYLTEEFVVPRGVSDYLNGLLEGYREDSRRFFIHVVATGRKEDGLWVPVSQQFIDRFTPTVETRRLVSERLVEEKPHDWLRGLSKEWRPASRVLLHLSDLLAKPRGGGLNEEVFVDVVSRKPVKRAAVTRLNDDNKKPFPALIREALSVLEHGYFNDEAVAAHLAHLRSQYDLAKLQEERYIVPGAEYVEGAPEVLLARLRSDAACYSALRRQQTGPVAGGAVQYRLAYTVQRSGRISQVGGAAQSCSRAMKGALYAGIPATVNYDLKSSQAYILRDFLHQAGMDTSWLDGYLAGDKSDYAREVGVSVDGWKQSIYALFMGAYLPGSLHFSKVGKLKEYFDGASASTEVVGSLEDVLRGLSRGSREAGERYRRFAAVVRPLYRVLLKWRRYLEEEWVPQNGHPNVKGVFVRNAVGMRLQWTRMQKEEESEMRRRGRLAAFLLQGKEAAFIHRLTAALPAHGVVPISNEHDGLVTLGQIPPPVIEEVKSAENMPYAVLEKKAWEPPGKAG